MTNTNHTLFKLETHNRNNFIEHAWHKDIDLIDGQLNMAIHGLMKYNHEKPTSRIFMPKT